MPFTPRAQVQSVVQTTINTEVSLASSPAAGGNSFTLDAVPDGLAAGTYLIVDAFTSQAELRKVSSVTGTTVVVTAAFAFAHTAGDSVLTIFSQTVSTDMWGCKGDNSTDDQIPLQQAVIECALNGELWLDGMNRTVHRISHPLMINSSSKLRNLRVQAMSSFAPAETNNAMVMGWNGNMLAVTGSASTDILTTPTAHGIPADDIGVVFDGTGLPGGLTAGKFYYVRDRTTFTFKVSATAGGAAVDLSSDGSGRVFCEVYAANGKQVFENCLFNGSLVSGLNGVQLSVQQQGYADTLRIDNFTSGYGLMLKGQQYVMTNFEVNACDRALVLDDMSFLWVYGFNAETFVSYGIHTIGSGARSCLFEGMHLEFGSLGTEIGVYLDNSAANMIFDNVSFSSSTVGATGFKIDAASAGQTSYSIRAATWANGIASTGQIMVNDVNRGVSLDVWDDCRNQLHRLDAPLLPSSQSADDYFPILVIGPGGRRIAYGSQNDDQPQMHIRPASSAQTGDQLRSETSAGARVSGLNKDGVLFTQRNTVPADGDLVAGELTFWLDSTNGACKAMFKAKQADGTVRTGSVALT